MSPVLFFLALALAGLLASLLRDAVPRRFSSYLPLLLFTCACLFWVIDPRSPGERAFPSELSAAVVFARTLACSLLGAASFVLATGQPLRGSSGLGFGVLASVLGALAYRWIGIGEAFRRLGWVFAGGAAALIPFWYALTLAFTALIILHPALRDRSRKAIVFSLLFWAGLTGGVEWNLRQKRGYGPANLLSAAGLSKDQAVAWARADLNTDAPARFMSEVVAADSIPVIPENIRRLRLFLQDSGGRGVFSRDAADLLRKSLLLSWLPEEALDAMSFSAGHVIPDYRQALALLRAGPLSEERLAHVRYLADSALNDPRGFETVGQSQFIFEAFSTAFARFSDSEQARFWLNKVWRLWPIFEKKVEINPVEAVVSGMISGIVTRDGEPAEGLRVGLFYVSAATTTYRDGANLCCAATIEDSGRFRFFRLGAGSYRLSLRGEESLSGSRVLDAPGTIELTEDNPSRLLPPIRLAR